MRSAGGDSEIDVLIQIAERHRQLWLKLFGELEQFKLEPLGLRLCNPAQRRGISVAEASEITRMNQPACLYFLNQLKKRGFVRLGIDPNDRRRRIIIGTDALCETMREYVEELRTLLLEGQLALASSRGPPH